MFLGILSDSHDDEPNIEKAIKIFNETKVDHIYHAGDIHTPRMLDRIMDIRSPSTFDAVFGNSDTLKTEFCKINGGRFNFHYGFLKFVHEKKRFLMTHDPENIERFAGDEKFDCIIYGHTHLASAKMINGVLHINPGETARKRSVNPSIAILELPSLQFRFIALD